MASLYPKKIAGKTYWYLREMARVDGRDDYYYGSEGSIKRSLYIGDSLYTISDGKIKINRLSDLAEEASIGMVPGT